MSQDYHQGIFNSFSNGFERSQQQQQQLAQQIRRDKLRGYEQPPPPLVGIEEEESGGGGGLVVYETGGMLSEMFNFQGGGSGSHAAAAELLDQSMARQQQQPQTVITNSEWFSNHQRQSLGGLGPLTDVKNQNSRESTHQHQISGINADSAAAMQLFLMNPQPKSPSPPPSSSNSTIHVLLPNPSSTSLQGFGAHDSDQGPPYGSGTIISPQQLSWEGGNTGVGGNVEGQGLSLSLSSSLQHLEAAKDGGLLYYSQDGGSSSAGGMGGSGGGGFGYFKNFPTHNQHQTLHLQGAAAGSVGKTHPVHVGFGSSVGVMNVMRNSKYAKPAQELLEEFCSVGRGQFKKNKFGKLNTNPSSSGGGGGGGGTGSSSSTKEVLPLSASDRIEHQRRKVKLLSMLDEIDRRYNHYCEQMQMVVNSFDLAMGYGAAVPYTALAQKAMSRHFRCLKDAIAAQLKHSCELLGEKDGAGTSGITKGETPRLKLLDQSLRQQRAFHQMGIMEQEAWRPQRGLPERSVNILRAWLFEHFLHPYPSDADKHLLSRQTGLSRNQVSNWFINARVRLWKPMIEEMYHQESKEAEGQEEASSTDHHQDRGGEIKQLSSSTNDPLKAQTPTPTGKRSQINANESDSSLLAISTTQQCNFSETPATTITTTAVNIPPPPPPQPHHQGFHDLADHDTCLRGSYVNAGAADYGTTTATVLSSGNACEMGSTLIRFGTTTTSTAGGDVSLTLGLRHAGTNNMPHDHKSSSNFSIRDFGSSSFN